VQIIRPEGAWMKIDQIRGLQRQISRRPMEGRYKVYILTDVERMNLPAANSFLKTLEEPPGASVLILLTSNYNALLPTIRSRCQLIRFFLTPPTVLQNQLVEKLKLTETKAKQITLLSGGKVGKALELAKKEDINTESTIPDILKRPQLIEIFKIAEDLNNQPESLDILLTWLRDILLVKQGCNAEILTYPDKFSELAQLASSYSRIQIQGAIKDIMETKNLLQRNINSTLALEVMVLKLVCQMRET
jgi:DNA polymerase-3 subunit delta'